MSEDYYYPKVEELLQGRGYHCYQKVWYGKNEFDVVGISRNGEIRTAVVEVKEIYLRKLIDQALRRRSLRIFNEIYIAYPFRYRLRGSKAALLKRAGIGAIDLSNMDVVIEPEYLEVSWEEQAKFISHIQDSVREVGNYAVELNISLAYDDYVLLLKRLKRLGIPSAGELLRRIASGEVEINEI